MRLSSNTIPIYKELIVFLGTQKIDLEEIESKLTDNGVKFIQGIKSAKWPTDEDACESIFGKVKSKNYNKLKGVVRRAIISSISGKSNPHKAFNPQIDVIYKKLNQDFTVYNLLKGQNYSTSAVYIGELLIANSVKYSFSEFILKVTSELIEYFSIFNLNPSKVKHYIKIQEEFTGIILWEQKAYLTYSKMMNLFIKEFSPGKKAIIISDEFLPAAQHMVGKINSIRFHLRYFLIKVFHHYSQKDFLAMDSTAQAAGDYFKNLNYRRYRTENMFLRKRVEANLILNNIELCKLLLNTILQNSILGDSNWYNTLEITTTLQIHEKQYNEAIKSFLSGKINAHSETVSKTIFTRWGLLEAYINFLQLAGVAPESPTMSRYRINRFINETPQYSEDKKGRNIQLIIAQLLFYIIDKNWDKMEEKIDALQKYGTRYLRKNELFRSQVFIKMLLEIPRRMYHPQAIIRHTAKYRKRLEEMAPNIDLNGSTLEIIPYEHLWDLIIQNIVPPKYTRKSALAADSKT